jgi:molybdenum cofactor biosynthesis enzyme MoaA
MNSDMDTQRTTVIDVTYLCNARCLYCQWGNPVTPDRIHRPLGELLVPQETLRALGTERVVLSGGEPRLHPQLLKILSYYRSMTPEVIVITNGYGLDESEANQLVEAGATGITISMDSTDPEEASYTRMVPTSLFSQLMRTLERISGSGIELEIGVTSVASSVTANWRTLQNLLAFATQIRASFVKFQPVFDDGYLGRKAPDLMLTRRDVPSLLKIAEKIDGVEHPQTNPPGFWYDIASLLYGKTLSPSACGLGPRQSIAIRGRLCICFWLESITYGNTQEILSEEKVTEVRTQFDDAKRVCRVGFQCFCTQNLSHVWMERPE